MPVSVQELADNQRTVPVPFDGEVVNVTYKPGLVTRDFLSRTSMDDLDTIIAAINALVVSWDVLDKGDVYPPTIENLNKLGRRFLMVVLSGIVFDTKPGKAKSAT